MCLAPYHFDARGQGLMSACLALTVRLSGFESSPRLILGRPVT